MQEADPACTFTSGMTGIVWKLAQALVTGDKAPDLTSLSLLTELEAAPHDVDMTLRLLNRRKGNGIRVLLRTLVRRESGSQLDLRRAPKATLPSHLRNDDRVYVVATGDVAVRSLIFRRDPVHPFEEC